MKLQVNPRNLFRWLEISLLTLFVIAVLAWVGDLAWHVIQLKKTLDAAIGLNRQGIGEVSLVQVNGLILKADENLSAIQRDVKPLFPLFRFTSPVPWIGRYVGVIEPGLKYAGGLVKAGGEITRALQPLWDAFQGNGGEDFLPGVMQTLQAGQPAFKRAADAVQLASLARVQIDPSVFPADLGDQYRKLDDNFNLIQSGVDLLQVLPGLMGVDRPQTYLILAQNSDELRATGGFITAIGLVTLDHGKVIRFELKDSYKADDLTKEYPLPPAPMQTYMLSGIWLPRDANWSPDFPTAARQAQTLYELSGGVTTDGVIAFDQTAVRSLLEVLGPVIVPGFPDAVTTQNVEDYMHQAWAPEPDQGFNQQWWDNRKNFIPELGKQLLSKMLSIRDKDQLFKLVRLNLDGMRSGHLLVYFKAPEAQAVMEKMGLDGSLNPGVGDYLELVDSNIGFNKVDAVIQRSIEYQVDLTDLKRPKASLHILYQHPMQQEISCRHEAVYSQSYQGMQARCYWDYWRVFTRAVKLTDWQTDPVPADWLLNKQSWIGPPEFGDGERGTRVISGLLVLPTRKSQNVNLYYDLASSVVQAEPQGFVYLLRVKKQPGLKQLPLTLQVSTSAGYVLSSSGEGWQLYSGDGIWQWKGALTQDQDFKLVFTRP